MMLANLFICSILIFLTSGTFITLQKCTTRTQCTDNGKAPNTTQQTISLERNTLIPGKAGPKGLKGDQGERGRDCNEAKFNTEITQIKSIVKYNIEALDKVTAKNEADITLSQNNIEALEKVTAKNEADITNSQNEIEIVKRVTTKNEAELHDQVEYLKTQLNKTQINLNQSNERIRTLNDDLNETKNQLSSAKDKITRLEVKMQMLISVTTTPVSTTTATVTTTPETISNDEDRGCDNSTTEPPTRPPTTTMPPTEPPTTTVPQPPVNMKDCTELYSNGFTSDGVYEIKPENGESISVYCQEGWTVIQKRSDDSVNYRKNMEEYGRGFGQIDGEHWLGLNAMNKLTEQGSYTIRIELEAFDGETAWAEYSNFHVSPGTDYTLTFDKGSYRGTAGDSLSRYSHNMKFSTYDMDQDRWGSGSCSTDHSYKGDTFGGCGWWFRSCGNALTAMPYGSQFSINWNDFRINEPLKAVVMKIQRV